VTRFPAASCNAIGGAVVTGTAIPLNRLTGFAWNDGCTGAAVELPQAASSRAANRSSGARRTPEP
jgi:hypothetical protein